MLDGSEHRILIIGCSGAGKSTLARRLGPLLDLPVIHLDQHYWSAGWQEPDPDEWIDAVAALLHEPRWIMDGYFGGTLEQRVAACDLVVFLDFPTRVCIWRVLRRWMKHRKTTRADMAPGCPEGIDLSFLAWTWRFRMSCRPRILRLLSNESIKVVTLRRSADTVRFLRDVQLRSKPSPANSDGDQVREQ